MKSTPKINISFNFYHLFFSTVLDRKANTAIWILKQLTLFLLLFFRISFLSILVCSSFLCFVFRQLSSISCGICLSFKSRHLELSCKIFIQLSSTVIFVELWSRGPPYYFAEQLFFFWHVINKCNQIIRQVTNQIIKHHIRKKN